MPKLITYANEPRRKQPKDIFTFTFPPLEISILRLVVVCSESPEKGLSSALFSRLFLFVCLFVYYLQYSPFQGFARWCGLSILISSLNVIRKWFKKYLELLCNCYHWPWPWPGRTKVSFIADSCKHGEFINFWSVPSKSYIIGAHQGSGICGMS